MEYTRYTIEDCLEMLTGSKSTLGSFKVDPKDATVLTSMAKQIVKGKALTDRQYELLRSKMADQYYVDQFAKNGLNAKEYYDALNDTRMPLRDIDRSKYVTLVDHVDSTVIKGVYNRSKIGSYLKDSKSQLWIKIGFPFSKRLIATIDQIAITTPYYIHSQGTRDHYFKFDEKVTYEIVREFKNKEFEIDEELLDFYEKLDYIKTHEESFMPKVADGVLENFHPATQEYLTDMFGLPCVDNVVQYKDVSLLYDIRHFDSKLLREATKKLTPLSDCLINRTTTQVLVRPTDWTLENVVDSIAEIKRMPLLFIVSSDTALKDLKQSYALVSKHVAADEVSVLFRLDNDTNADFNDYVKNQGLNSPVTKDTKVVYICKDKLPKPLLKAEWTPRSVVRLGSNRVQTKIDQWTYECDLVIHFDQVATQWAPTYASSLDIGSKKRKIEKI